MARLSEEVVQVQNPALGALLQWRFATGYTNARSDAAASPLVLSFLVLPVLFHEETRQLLASTNKSSGLRGFATKFGSSKIHSADILLSLHERVSALRSLSLASLRVGLSYRLVSIDAEGNLLALSRTPPRALIPTSIRTLVTNAEKFGGWAADLTLFEIASTLKVRF